jgi:hypothetical protein
MYNIEDYTLTEQAKFQNRNTNATELPILSNEITLPIFFLIISIPLKCVDF